MCPQAVEATRRRSLESEAGAATAVLSIIFNTNIQLIEVSLQFLEKYGPKAIERVPPQKLNFPQNSIL